MGNWQLTDGKETQQQNVTGSEFICSFGVSSKTGTIQSLRDHVNRLRGLENLVKGEGHGLLAFASMPCHTGLLINFKATKFGFDAHFPHRLRYCGQRRFAI